MKLKQLICLLLAAVVLGACGSPAGPTEATEETKPTDAWLDPVVPSDAVESSEKPEPVEDLTVPDQTAAVGGANFALGLLRTRQSPTPRRSSRRIPPCWPSAWPQTARAAARWRRWNMPSARSWKI
mgnify:CR=1 FL=1